MTDDERWEYYNDPAHLTPADGPPQRRRGMSAEEFREAVRQLLIAEAEADGEN